MTHKLILKVSITWLSTIFMPGVGCVKGLITVLKTVKAPRLRESINSKISKSKSYWVHKPSAEVLISEQFL